MHRKWWFICLIMLTVAFVIAGCTVPEPKYPNAEGVNPDAALTLRKDFLKYFRSEYPDIEVTMEDLWVSRYYGTYSGCEVVYMAEPIAHTDEERKIVVAGYVITVGSSKRVYVHKDSHFYTIKEAYEAGYITEEDVADFGPKIDPLFFAKWDEEKYTEDGFLKVPRVDADTELQLREDYLRQFGSKYPELEMTLEEISLQHYEGTYNGCEIVYMGSPLYKYVNLYQSVVVAGYLITYESNFEPYVHKGDCFYTVKEAYEAGYITQADVEAVFDPVKKWEGEEVPEQETLNPVTALKLRKEYLQQLHLERPEAKDIELCMIFVNGYYGTYSGCEIVLIGAPVHCSNTQPGIRVAGYYILINDIGQKLYVYKDSHFYNLKEAYEKGCITKEDIATFGPLINSTFRKLDE